MCQALAREHDVTLFCPAVTGQLGPPEIYRFYGVEPTFGIKRLPRSDAWHHPILPAALVARLRIALGRFDLVYARCNAWQPYRLHKIDRPMILEAHVLRRAGMIEKLFRRPLLRGLVVISDGLRQDYREAYDLDHLEVLIAHDGADPAVIPSVPAALPGSNAIKCGYVGNLYRGKGIETILPLAARCPQVDFHVFGGTEEQVAQWRPDGGAHAANIWFHGALAPADTDAARLACDLLIAPYQNVVSGVGGTGNLVRWMSPLKIFEYMAAGKAIIASDLPTLREVLRDRDNALLVPPDDLDAWARAVCELAADAAERQRLGARALSDFAGQHSWQARAHRIMAAFAPPEVGPPHPVPRGIDH
jgi:glycosyltransferase involved in cell wall biosynthesis